MAAVGAIAKGLGIVDKPKRSAPAAVPEEKPGRSADSVMAGQQAAAMRARRRGFRSLLGRSDEGQTGLTDKLGG